MPKPFNGPSQDAFAPFPSYLSLSPSQLSGTAATSGPSLDASPYRHYTAQYFVNGGTLVGAANVEGSNDGINWVQLQQAGIGSSPASGSLQGDFFGMQIRMQALWSSGSNASFTGSITLRS